MFDLNSYLVYIRHRFCSFLVPFATYFCAGSCLLPLVFNCIFEFAKIFMTVCGHHVPLELCDDLGRNRNCMAKEPCRY